MSLGHLDLGPLVRDRDPVDLTPTHLRFIQQRSFYAGKIIPGGSIRIRSMSLSLLDLDPLVRGTDPVDLTRPISASFSGEPFMPVRLYQCCDPDPYMSLGLR